ncbi:Hypothetical protein PHPALM_36200 [Phytophthora palmivora]|uniref:Uncharacterized protein n=1 Tax=Phytophthora palmivora TaxID=4796 RepID=A0A2P4X0K8_9STRA|nr:Hypothetical protein PHPALM_36200 [Phytophthora palmivora]
MSTKGACSSGFDSKPKVCSVHLRFNTTDKFKSLKLNMQRVNSDIFNLQTSLFPADYDSKIIKIAKTYPIGVTKIVVDKEIEEYVWSYLRKVNSTDRSVVGNLNPSPEEMKLLVASWGNVQVHGQPSLLFGVRSTSAVEGDNNGLLWGGVINKLILGSVMAFCSCVLNFITKRKTFVQNWTKKKDVARLNVVASSVHIFYVFDAFSDRNAGDCVQLYEVNLESKLFSNPLQTHPSSLTLLSKQSDTTIPYHDSAYMHGALHHMQFAFHCLASRRVQVKPSQFIDKLIDPIFHRRSLLILSEGLNEETIEVKDQLVVMD